MSLTTRGTGEKVGSAYGILCRRLALGSLTGVPASSTPPSRHAASPQPRNASERALVALARLPRPVPVLGVLLLLIIGAFVPTYGWIATAIVVLFLVWILSLSWPRLTGIEKLMRFAVIALVAAVAIIQSRPR